MRTCPACQRSYPDDTDFCPRDGTSLVEAISATITNLEAGLARRFKILRKLGEGGMGAVFLAEQIAVGNRQVALKVLLRKLLDDPEFALRFQNEAASTGRIRHPNVVTIYESGQSDDGSPYIAMEYLEGETLRHTIKTRGALPVAECAAILQQVARGLNAAHKLGTLHRDLKPDNIFLAITDEGEGVVKVMDFGLAKLRESTTHTITGTIMGTPAYMSPEQALGMRSEELDARSDLYALGITVYEMLTGRVPFHSDTPIGYLHKHIMEAPPPLSAISPGLVWPAELEAVVMKSLAKKREERFATALEFSKEFSAAAGRAPGAGVPATLGETIRVEQMTTPVESARALPSSGPAGVAAPLGAPETEVDTPTTPVRQPTPPPPAPRREPSAPHVAPATAQRVPSVPPPVTAPPPQKSRMKYYIGGALLILMAATVGGWLYVRSRANAVSVGSAGSAAETGSVTGKPAGAPPGMFAIPAGSFVMGRDNAADPEETPAHSVKVGAFFMDVSPVTNAKYAGFLRHTDHAAPPAWTNGTYPAQQGERPVTGVSWNDARDYCQAGGERLPTEAEWEYAARGTDSRLYPWGNEFSQELVNSRAAARGGPDPVGARPGDASPFGVLDMSGNVWQWTADDYKPYPGRQPAFAIPADAKALRGGSFQSDQNHVTATTRNLDHASARSREIGFRCAKSQ